MAWFHLDLLSHIHMLGSITIAAASADGPNGVYSVDWGGIIFCGEVRTWEIRVDTSSTSTRLVSP